METEENTFLTDADPVDPEEPATDKTSEDTPTNEPEEEGDEKKKTRRSEIAQKIKYREKLQKSNERVTTLEKELQDLKSLVKKPSDDQEAKAQEYIRSQARQVFEELQKARDAEKKKDDADFAEAVEEVLEINPDISEEELLDTIEELDVSPKIAARILKRSSDVKKEKPKLPKAKAAPPSIEEKKVAPDDKGKTLWQIAKEEASKFAGK